MFKGILNIINQRYPVSQSKKEILLSSLFIAVMGYLFLVVFQPFGAHTFTNRFKYLLLAPYALIAFLVYSSANMLFRKQDINWSLFKELIKIFCMLLVCSGLNYVYNIYFINHVTFSITHLLSMVIYTFAIAVPVSMTYVLGRYIYLARYWNASVEAVNEPVQEKTIVIIPDVGLQLTLAEADFLFAESEGNYTMIHLISDGKPVKQLLRLSLKTLESQLGSNSLVRCHRSFIVNTNKVTKMKGNAQGYKLTIDGIEAFVPVSRTYIPEIQKKFRPL